VNVIVLLNREPLSYGTGRNSLNLCGHGHHVRAAPPLLQVYPRCTIDLSPWEPGIFSLVVYIALVLGLLGLILFLIVWLGEKKDTPEKLRQYAGADWSKLHAHYPRQVREKPGKDLLGNRKPRIAEIGKQTGRQITYKLIKFPRGDCQVIRRGNFIG
jgi:hypothetical protein